MISSLCEKQGITYEQFAKQLSLADYSRLKTAISDTVRRLARETIDRKKVKHSLLDKSSGMCLCD